MNIVTTTIKSRHSVRNYKKGPVSDSIIQDVLTCAGKAPTARNIQPWLIGVIRNPELLHQIAGMTDNGKFIGEAAVCFAVFGEKAATYYLEDCSAATENIILALQAHGFGSCWVAGDKKSYAEQIRVLLQVPAQYTLVSLVPAGVPSDIAIASKKDLKDITFFDRYSEQ
jgi:nitroreductase